MPKDLEFIRSVVKTWPEGAESVRLDYDGEICFMGHSTEHDFFPINDEEGKEAFIPDIEWECGYLPATGTQYTHKQWAGEKK